jgi:hypothetical protein
VELWEKVRPNVRLRSRLGQDSIDGALQLACPRPLQRFLHECAWLEYALVAQLDRTLVGHQ